MTLVARAVTFGLSMKPFCIALPFVLIFGQPAHAQSDALTPGTLPPNSQGYYQAADTFDESPGASYPAGGPPSRRTRPDTRFEITPTIGFQFGGSVSTSFGSLKLGDGMTTGVSFDYHLARESTIHLSYTHHNSSLERSDFGAPAYKLFDVGLHYIQLGGTVEYPHRSIRPFFGATLGATVFSPDSTQYTDQTRFSGALLGGVKFLFSKHIGLRAQTRLNVAVLDSNSAMFCGSGGCSYGFMGSGIAQIEFSGGLIAAF